MSNYDSFELLYVYLDKLERCFEKNEFTFTDEYKIKFYPKNKQLIIKPKESVYKNFFGEKVKSVNLIVGKNGCGKSTLLDLIGLKYNDRYSVFTNRDNSWFALYKCGKDNKFYIEGQTPELLLNDDFIYEKAMQYTYSFYMNYDYKNLNYDVIVVLGKNYQNDIPIVFYNRKMYLGKYLNNQRLYETEERLYLINREYIQTSNLASLYYLSTQNNKLYKEIESELLVLSFNIKYESQKKIEPLTILFDEMVKSEEYINLNNKEKFRFRLIQSIILDLYIDVIDTHDIEKKLNIQKDSNELFLKKENNNTMVFDEMYNSRKTINNILLKNMGDGNILSKINNMCKKICDIFWKLKEFGEEDSYFYKWIDSICSKIEQIPDEYIYYKISTQHIPGFPDFCSEDEVLQIVVELKDKFNRELFEFLVAYDKLNDFEIGDILKKILYVEFNHNISTGEIKFIQAFSGIYYSLTHKENYTHHEGKKSAIILLDEPDESFHPMWVSSFINNLIKLVNSFETDMTYQFIISTHSPFMLSDLPKEFVTRIEIDKNHKRLISRPNKSFASNYYDIIKDSFFLSSSIGDFAKAKINEIIQEINFLETVDDCKYVDSLRNKINIIDDEFLKEILNKKLEEKIASIDKNYGLKLKKLKLEEEMEKINKELAEMDKKSGEDHD